MSREAAARPTAPSVARAPVSTDGNILTRIVVRIEISAKGTDVVSYTDREGAAVSAELERVVESETETITGALSSGETSLAELDRFVHDAERGAIDGDRGIESVVRIVRSLLRDDDADWAEMEPARPAAGS